MNDERLVERVVSGDVQAFGDLVHRYQGLVFTVLVRMVRDRGRAEELLQESFLKAYRKLADLRNRAHFKAWLLQIATNEALKSMRRQSSSEKPMDFSDERLTSLFADEESQLSLVGVEEAVQRIMDCDCVGRALDELSDTYRVPIILRYYADLSYKEVAERMGISLAATKFRLHYGVRMLKALVMKVPGG